MSASSSTLVGASPVEQRSKFFVGMALGMLLVNLVGFAPTLYLRPFFDVPPIPAYLYLHGALGTAWFVLLVVQTLLVANGRVGIHRQLGVAGVALAALLVITGVYTSANMVPRNVALGLTSETDMTLYEVVTAADNAAFIIFPTLVLLAVYFRRRPDAHKRLVLLASWSILGPAVARILNMVAGFPNSVGPGRFVGAAIIFGFLIALLVYDVWVRRRPHLATVLGALFFFAVNFGVQLSGIGPALVESRLEQLN
jgi:hypothetical protein